MSDRTICVFVIKARWIKFGHLKTNNMAASSPIKNSSLTVISEQYTKCCNLYEACKAALGHMVTQNQEQGVIIKFKNCTPSNVWPGVESVLTQLKIEFDAVLNETKYEDAKLHIPKSVTMVGCNESSYTSIGGNSMRAYANDGRTMVKDPTRVSNREFVTKSLSEYCKKDGEWLAKNNQTSNHDVTKWANLDTDFVGNNGACVVLQFISDLSIARCKLGALCIANARVQQAIDECKNPERDVQEIVKNYKDCVGKFEKVRKGMQRKQHVPLDQTKPEDRNTLVDYLINTVSGKEAPYFIPYREVYQDVKGVQSLSFNRVKPTEIEENRTFWDKIETEQCEIMNAEFKKKDKVYDSEAFGADAFFRHVRDTGISPSVPGLDWNCPDIHGSNGTKTQYTNGRGEVSQEIPALVYIKAMRAMKKGCYWVVKAEHVNKSRVHYYNVKSVQPVLTTGFFYKASNTSGTQDCGNTYTNPFDDINNEIIKKELSYKRKRENHSTIGKRCFEELCVEEDPIEEDVNE